MRIGRVWRTMSNSNLRSINIKSANSCLNWVRAKYSVRIFFKTLSTHLCLMMILTITNNLISKMLVWFHQTKRVGITWKMCLASTKEMFRVELIRSYKKIGLKQKTNIRLWYIIHLKINWGIPTILILFY
jgi:hypothetical protein